MPVEIINRPYGIRHSDLPMWVQNEIDEYVRWCMMPINTSRGACYSNPVQYTTIEKNLDTIRAFLGFVVHRLGLSHVHDKGLASYWDPSNIASFISFLFERKVGRGTIEKHLAVAKKMNMFLASTACKEDRELQHVAAMEKWLTTLERQCRTACPSTPKDSNMFPHATLVRAWAEDWKQRAITTVLKHEAAYGKAAPLPFSLAKLVSTGVHVQMKP